MSITSPSHDRVHHLQDITGAGILLASFHPFSLNWQQSHWPSISFLRIKHPSKFLLIVHPSKRTEKEFYNYHPQQGGSAALQASTITDLTNLPNKVTTTVDNVVYPQETITAGILQRANNLLPRCQWRPIHPLPTKKSRHPIELLIPTESFQLLQVATQQEPNTVLVHLTEVREQNITTTCLRELLAHGEMTNDTILNTFLEVSCAQHNLTYLSTFFIHLLQRDKAWLPYWFAETPDLQTHSFPCLQSNLPILIPCHVQGAHWVGLVRRVVNDRVYFLYADDLNQVRIEMEIKSLLQTHSPKSFYPDSAIWMTCNSTTFYPHSNECGPRTLFALMAMALHPTPNRNILLPFMDPNLAQILRTWIGATLLTGIVEVPQWSIQPHNLISLRGTSVPGYLFPWNGPPRETEFTHIPHQASVRKVSPSTKKQNSAMRSPIDISRTSPTIQSLPSQPGSDLVKLDRKVHQHPPIQTNRNCIQLTLPDVFNKSLPSSHKSTQEEVWGHHPETIDDSKTLRIVFSNPRGLKLSTDILETEFSLGRCRALGVGALCIAESNLNWSHLNVKRKFYGMLRKIWKHTTTSTSHTNDNFVNEKQPGGTATVLCNHWTSRVIEKGADPFGLGRWSYIVLRGKGGRKILVITAYRVCKQTINSAGPTTSTAQQFRVLSEQFRAADRIDDPIPRRQFIVDLQGWIEHKTGEGYQIILGIDANEPFIATDGNFTPVQFTSDQPIPIKGHDGTLATLVRTCGLQDPLLIQHPDTPPPTYDRGQEKIDFIFISTSLLSSVSRTGIFPYNSLFLSDHRPCYIDLDGEKVFKEHTPVIAPPQHRGLRLHDPRLVDQYIATLVTQLNYHKVPGKITALLKAANNNTWISEDTVEYEKLDKIITEAMIHAERNVSKKVSLTYQWSPKLKAAIHTLTYWKLRLSQLKGKTISNHTLTKIFKQTTLPNNLARPLPIESVINEIRQARITLKEVQKHHIELREQHLEDLVHAIILYRRPHLLEPGKEKEYTKKKQKEIKRIQRRESLVRLHRKIGHTLKPDQARGGLCVVDIPHSQDNDPFPVGPDPKTWTGPWQTVTDPSTIAKHVCAANTRQYHQAHHTPCGIEPLSSYLGYKAEMPGSESIIQGRGMPSEILSTLLPETTAIFHTLTNLANSTHPTVDTQITPEHFKSCYRLMDERTSSSPSGRHIGHYKAATLSDELSQLHSNMMSIPLTAGFSPTRWQQIIDVMLEKKPGDHRIHRLRIVALQESDFNQSNRLVIGRPLQTLLEQAKLAPDMQHGSRASKQCPSAVLNKQLTFEIHRYLKQPIAYIENDAVGCYDRIMNPLILIFLRILGLSHTAVTSLATTWEHTFHRVRTMYGISEETYKNHPDCLLYGPGQGSTIGPFLWLLCFILIFMSLGDIPHISVRPVQSPATVTFVGEAFVDDAGLGTNQGDTHLQLVQNLQILAQRWEKLLFSTGGALNLSKCFWFLLSWRWSNGKPVLHTSTTAPATLKMTSENDAVLHTIPRIEPTASFRTLGVHISPSGSNRGALLVLRQIVLDYCSTITGSTLTRQEALSSYIQYLLPKIRFQPPVLSLSQQDCDKLTSLIMTALLPRLHVNRHTARSIIFGPEDYGGLSLPNLYITQGIDKLRLFLGHLRTQDRTGQLIQVDMTYLQLLSGYGQLFLNQTEKDFRWLESGWIQSLWTFTSKYSFTFLYPNGWIPMKSRENDLFLMEEFVRLKIPVAHMKILNRCRLYLQVITLSDISAADGRTILPEIKQGIRLEDRQSTLLWPTQCDPPQANWSLWRHYLKQFEDKGKLRQPLGNWVNHPHQTWHYFFDTATGWIYESSTTGQYGYPPLSRQRILRSGHWYDSANRRSCPSLPDNLYPASILSNPTIDGSLFQVCTSPNTIPQQVPAGPTSTTRLYYQSLIPPTESIPYDDLVQQDNIHITIETATDQAGHTSSSWTFHSTAASYSGGHTKEERATPYRATLRGILSALYIVYTMEQRSPSQLERTVIIQSSHKKALKEAFRDTPVGVTTATQPNQDLILDIRHLRHLINATILQCHCHGPASTGKNKYPILSNPLNTAFMHEPSVQNHSLAIDATPLSHIITIFHNSTAFTGNIKEKIHELEYQQQLEDKILKDNDWTHQQFHQIDWKAFSQAYKRIPRSHRISIMKLSHRLWNTNNQNSKFYGQPETCPMCTTARETVDHIFRCQHPAAVEHRNGAQQDLFTLLHQGTPQPIAEALQEGFTGWAGSASSTNLQSTTSGSRLPSLQSITEAFDSQTELGWGSLHRGHLSIQWKDAFKHNFRPNKPLKPTQLDLAADKWGRSVITAVWTYSEKLWRFRNQVVHGKTEINKISKTMANLHARAESLYNQFEVDPYMIPVSRTYLFNRPLNSTLSLSQDSLASWIRSVEEGLLTREHRERLAAESLKRTLHQFFLRKPKSSSIRRTSLWSPPFSLSHLRHETGHRSRTTPAKHYANTQRRGTKRNRKQIIPSGRTLLSYGFNLVKLIPKNSKRDSPQEDLEEYSGTRVSTAP